MMAQTKNMEAAREYTRRGWCVIPIPLGQKAPRLPNWQNTKLTEAELPLHFPGESNIGVLLGEPSGWLTDIDIDCREALVLAPYFLTETGLMFGRKSKPGSHWLYNCQGATMTKYQTQADGCFVELRSTGGQTMFPPSVHPSGETVTWHQYDEVTEVAVSELTQAVAKLAAAALLARHWPAEGARQEAALALAGGLTRAGWTEDEVRYFIEAICLAAGDEEPRMRAKAASTTARKKGRPITGFKTLAGLVGEDVVRTFREWLDIRAGAEPEEWDPPVAFTEYTLPPFPVDVLSGHVRAYVEAVATEKQVPTDLPGMLVLPALSTSIQKKAIVLVRPGWVEPVNIWTMCALPPGSRKSGTFESIVAPIEKYERQERDRLAPEVEQARNKRKIAEHRLNQLQNDAAKKRGHEAAQALAESNALAAELAGMNIPAIPELLADDISPEAVVRLMADQGGKISIMSPEADILEILAGRYSNGNPNLGAFLKAHAGDSIRVKRVGRPPDYVDKPALTMGISPQPDMLRGFIDRPSFRGRGLLGRFLYSLPASNLGSRRIKAAPVPAGVAWEYEQTLMTLLQLEPATNTEGVSTAHVLRMDFDAEAIFNAFEEWLEPQLAPMGELGSMTDWAGKLAGAVARIAGLLHMAEHMTEGISLQIAADTISAAVKLAREYLIPHAKAAYAKMGADPEIEAARYTWEVIQDKCRDKFKKQDVWQWTKGRFEKVDQLNAALVILSDRNYLREIPAPNKQGAGRKAAPSYEVNPLATSYNTYNTYNSHKGSNFRDYRNSRMQDVTLEDAWEVSLDEL